MTKIVETVHTNVVQPQETLSSNVEHPLGTSTGAAAGAIIGAGIGMAAAGPLGAAVGAAIGAIPGAVGGEGIADTLGFSRESDDNVVVTDRDGVIVTDSAA